MKPLAANLKHLYQSSGIWLYNILFLAAILMLCLGSLQPDLPHRWAVISFYICIFSIWCFSCGIGSMISDVWNRPFAFCLPGQKETALKMLLLIWLSSLIISSLIMSRQFSRISGSGPVASLALFIGTFSMSYWLGVVMGISRRGNNLVFIINTSIIFFGLTLLKNPHAIIMAYPWSTAFITGLAGYCLYYYVKHGDHLRRLCGNPMFGFLDIYNLDKQKRLARAYMRMNQDKRPGKVYSFIGDFFSERMRRSHKSQRSLHLWGQIYLIAGSFAVQWAGILTCGFIVLFLFISVSLHGGDILSFMLVMLVIMTSAIGGWIGSSYKLDYIMPVGRSAYFLRGVVSMCAGILIAMTCIWIAILSFSILSVISPPADSSYSLSSFLWILSVLPVMLSPLFGGFMILLKLKPFTGSLTMGIIIVTVFALTGYGIIRLEDKPVIFDVIMLLLIAALTWGFHMCSLCYDSMKRPLC